MTLPQEGPIGFGGFLGTLTHLIERHENINEARGEYSPDVIKDLANTSVIGLNYRTSIESKWR